MDAWYIEILLRALAVPFQERGIGRSGQTTAPRRDCVRQE
jgi:hypothetical protein